MEYPSESSRRSDTAWGAIKMVDIGLAAPLRLVGVAGRRITEFQISRRTAETIVNVRYTKIAADPSRGM